MRKFFYKGTPIVASTMKEAIQKAKVIACSQNITRIRNILADVGLINRGRAFPSFEDELVKAIVANDYLGVKDKVKWREEACSWDGICLKCFSEHSVGFLAKDILSRYHKGVPFVKKVDKSKLMEKAMLQAVHDAGVDDIGKLSDGYHTFDDLYNQRCILFAKLVEVYKDKAWKTKRHEDGELCFGGKNFLVCIDTPQGPYSYHYPLKDWDLFKCKELPKAKHFDGHTSKDVGRILSL